MSRAIGSSLLGLIGTIVVTSGLACSAGSGDDSDSSGGAGGGTDSTGQGAGATTTGAQGGGFQTGSGGSGGGGGPPEVAEVYGHSAATLYRLDPITKNVTVVGDFDGCSGVIDIALDKDSNIIGTTFDGVYSIDKDTAACSLITSGDFPNSLSFIPAGTLDPNVEALVGYEADQYVRIDPVNGSKQYIGTYWNNGLVSSGDVVSVKNGKSFLTVMGNSCPTDCLVEIDPVTGAMIQNWGPLGYSAVYGIAFWAGSVYGFTEGGQLFEVTFPNQTLMTTLIASPPGTSFWGAGSTTSAPPEPIPQ